MVESMTNTLVDAGVCVNVRAGHAERPCDRSLPVTLEQRIRYALKRSGLSARALSMKANLSHGYLASVFLAFGKETEPSFGTGSLRAIARAAGVSSNWLLTGHGSPDDPEGVESEAPSIAPEYVAVQRFDGLPEWPELLTRAKALQPEIPAWVWEFIAGSRPLLSAMPTPAMVADLAVWVMRHESIGRASPPRTETGAQLAKPSKKRG